MSSYRNRSTIKSIIEEGLELKMTIKDLSLKEVIKKLEKRIYRINKNATALLDSTKVEHAPNIPKKGIFKSRSPKVDDIH